MLPQPHSGNFWLALRTDLSFFVNCTSWHTRGRRRITQHYCCSRIKCDLGFSQRWLEFAVEWSVTPCDRSLSTLQWNILPQSSSLSLTLVMEVLCSPETSVHYSSYTMWPSRKQSSCIHYIYCLYPPYFSLLLKVIVILVTWRRMYDTTEGRWCQADVGGSTLLTGSTFVLIQT